MKIGISGNGRVGSPLGYTLVSRGLADELVLYNRRPEVVGRHGVERLLQPGMNDKERQAFRDAADCIRPSIRLGAGVRPA